MGWQYCKAGERLTFLSSAINLPLLRGDRSERLIIGSNHRKENMVVVVVVVVVVEVEIYLLVLEDSEF